MQSLSAPIKRVTGKLRNAGITAAGFIGVTFFACCTQHRIKVNEELDGKVKS